MLRVELFFRRGWRPALPFVAALLLLPVGGCAHYKQVQYFEVVDQDLSGNKTTSFYRVTMKGQGSLVKKYKMNTAYVSEAALNTLTGNKVSIPLIDASDDSAESFVAVKNQYLKAVEAYAQAKAAIASKGLSTEAHEARVLELARQMWLASLSDGDLQSMGSMQTLDDHSFRKLVFYCSAEDINLQDYSTEIDSMVGDATALAEKFRAKKMQEETAAKTRKQERGSAIKALAGKLELDEKDIDALMAIMGLSAMPEGHDNGGEK